jgi:uncharacterized membrane protein
MSHKTSTLSPLVSLVCITIVTISFHTEVQATQPVKYPGWISAMEIVALILITGLALTIYLVHKRHHNKTNKKE